jgi:RNA polymerase sigma-70 factor (ECF subfamily)
MESSLSTRESLLVRLAGPDDHSAWSELLSIYGPVIHRMARHRGLQEADAADLCQEVFQSVARAIGRWHANPQRGRFRPWLFRIASNRLIDLLRARRRRVQRAEAGEAARAVENGYHAGQDEEDSQLLSRHLERQVLKWAAEQARTEFEPATWNAFWKTAVEGGAPREVALELGLSVGAVYIAKSRVIGRLRRLAQQFFVDQVSTED